MTTPTPKERSNDLKWINWPTWARRAFCFLGWHIERPVSEHYDQHFYGDMRETWSCLCEKLSYDI
jgi:hypothetical protein